MTPPPAPGITHGQVVLTLPFEGRWLTQNSPARRIPSHGTDLLAGRYAIDFVAVDARGRSGERRDWRTALATEPPQRFVGFGRPILAPIDGVVVDVHDGEVDHEARRSQLTLVPYALGQRDRLRQGVAAVAGNHVVVAIRDTSDFVALAHLKAGSMRVAVGDRVVVGQPIAQCGNSGNSTEPHLHMQVMDARNLEVAQGVPIAFRQFREWQRRAKEPLVRESGIPGDGSIVEAIGFG